MASTDAKPFSIKNTAYRATFPILDADGDLVTGAAGLDSEISKDGGTFADCTNEATEIATASGMYYLDLTATEMNADTVAIIVKTSTSGAKTTPIVMYPVEDTDIPVNVKAIGDAVQSATDLKDFADTGYDPSAHRTQALIKATDDIDLSATQKTSVNTEVDTGLSDIKLDHLIAVADGDDPVNDSIIAKLAASDGDWSGFDKATDALEALRDRGDAAWVTGAGGSDRLLMVDTTIATLASQTSFTLTAGSADDDAYNNCTIVIEDASTATQKAVGLISNYVGASKTVTLKYNPGIFTIATTDKVYILAENALKATLANRQLNVAADGDIAGNVDGSVASVTADVSITQAAADKVWGTAARALTDKAGFALSAAGITSIWEKNISAFAGAGYAGTYLKTVYDDWLNGGRLDLILDIIAADVVNLDGDAMRGTDSAALASVCTDARLGELDAANIPADIDTLLLRLSDTRTGYIDNLSGGAVALATICTEARLAHLDADMTSRSSHAAADVWSVGTRSLTGKTGFSLSTSGIDAIWDELTSGHTVAGSFGQRFQIVRTATVQNSTKYKTTLDIGASTVDNFYNTEVLYIVGGTGAGQSRKIESYNGSTKKATVTTGWSTNPDNTSIFIIFPTSVETGSGASAQQVWEYATREITDKADFSLAASQEVQLNAQGKLDVNAEVDTALSDIKLDHLIAVADSDDPVNDSIIAKLAASDGDWSGFDKTTEALEAIRDRGDSAWITGAGESAANVADAVWNELIADHTGGTTFGGKNQKVVPSETLADYKADVASLALEATLTAMKGATYVESTDSLEALRNRGDAAWITATGFSTHAAADIWSVGTRALTDKAGFSLSTAGILAIWHQLTANIVTANTIGKLLKDDINATISSRSSHSAADVWSAASRELSTPANYKADVSALALEATLTDIKGTGFVKDTHSLPQCLTATGFSTHAAADIWSVGTRALTEKAGFALSSAAITAIWEKNISAFSGAGYAGTYLKTLYADWLNGGRLDLILDIIAADVVNIDGDAMRGTDGANTTTPPTVNEIADQVWDELLTGGSHNISTSAGRRLRELSAYAIESDTAQAGTTTTITLAATANGGDGIFNRNLIVLIGGTGVGQTRTIADYNNTTKVCVVDREWHINPDATSEYQILADDTPLVVDHGKAQAGTSTTITLRDYASATNDVYLCNIIAIIGGTGRGQARLVGSYVGSTKVVTICGDNWVTTPDATSVYAMVPYGTSCASCMGTTALTQINTECDTALTDYDPPTRTEATADKDAVIAEVDANETKIDTIDGVVDAILLDTGTDGVVVTSGSKTGYALSAAGVDAIMDEVVEGTLTFRQMLRLFTSVLAGKSTGGGTVTLAFRDIADGKDRISATVDANGNRTAITLDGT